MKGVMLMAMIAVSYATRASGGGAQGEKKEYQARRELDQPAGVEPAAMTAECGCHETWVADQSRTAAVCAYTEGAECHQRSQGPPDSPSLAGLKCIRLA